MPAPKSDKTSMEEFIKAVMHAESMSDAARKLGLSRQAVSKRLAEYRARGIRGLPEFDGRTVDNDELQRLVNQQRRVAKKATTKRG